MAEEREGEGRGEEREREERGEEREGEGRGGERVGWWYKGVEYGCSVCDEGLCAGVAQER